AGAGAGAGGAVSIRGCGAGRVTTGWSGSAGRARIAPAPDAAGPDASDPITGATRLASASPARTPAAARAHRAPSPRLARAPSPAARARWTRASARAARAAGARGRAPVWRSSPSARYTESNSFQVLLGKVARA